MGYLSPVRSIVWQKWYNGDVKVALFDVWDDDWVIKLLIISKWVVFYIHNIYLL